MQKQELLTDYIADMRELLDNTERALLTAEQHISGTGRVEAELLNEIFRYFHTIKGTSGFFSLTTIVKVSHQAEALLDQLRSGAVMFVDGMEDQLIDVCDFLRGMIDLVEETGADAGREDVAADVVAKLTAFLPAASGAAETKKQRFGLFGPPEPAPAASTSEASAASTAPGESGTASGPGALTGHPESAVTLDMYAHFTGSAKERIESILAALSEWMRHPDSVPQDAVDNLEALGENCGLLDLPALKRLLEACSNQLLNASDKKSRSAVGEAVKDALDAVLVALPGLPNQEPFKTALARLENQPAPSRQESPKPESPKREAAVSRPDDSVQHQERQDIRIATSKLDSMMNLVGELVVAESLVTQHKDLQGVVTSDFTAASRQLGKIVRHLQEVALSMRMVPLSGVFQRMTRLIWDLSRKSGKKAALTIEGEETEVDKTIAELVADPLIHILRNSVDHGLETTEGRRTAGKPETGSVLLKARHSGGEVQISIQDDGHGLDRQKILERAHRQGIITGTGEDMPDEAVWELIFLPGFSTAEKVTDISGRGVGMDVVRKNITALNGRIDVKSKAGEGTSFVLRIPLTLAIIEGLVARIGSVHFIVPTTDILKSLQYSAVNVTRLDQGEHLADYRGEFFPVLSLASLLNMPGAHETLNEKSLIVQVGHTGRSVGIIVDELLGNQHIVVKPLNGLVKNSKGVSGCTILGDGSVALIVDVGYLTRMVSYSAAGDHKESERKESAAR